MDRSGYVNPLFRFKNSGIVIAAVCAVALSLGASARESTKPVAIRNVRIFDGERVIPNGTVVIGGRKIAAVGRNVSIPEDAEIIEGDGMTLLPGLIDAHVHVWSEKQLEQSLVFGVTTVVDMFTSVEIARNLRKEASSGRADDRAGMISAGTLVTAPGAHGTEYGIDIPTITKPVEAQAFVDARIAEGSDFIKIIYDGGSVQGKKWPSLDKATMAAVIRAAHKRNKLAVVHIKTLQGAREAIEARADGLAHLFNDDAFDPDFGRCIRRHKAFVIPTFSVLASVCGTRNAAAMAEDSCISPYMRPSDVAALKQSFPAAPMFGARGYEAAEKALKQLRAEGVPILAGTDAPNPGTAFGVSLHRELELLVQAGLSPVEALMAATSRPAETFGLSDRWRIRPRLNADILLVHGDPTKDITATRCIAAIWRNGARVDRERHRAAVDEEKVAAEHEIPESGLISDFESERITAYFGAGWSVSTDAIMGGKSTAEIRRAEGGAEESSGSMLITGAIADGSPNQWAGAFYSPGPTPVTPANLSVKKQISFWTKGDGKTYFIMIFTQSRGWMPSVQSFAAGPAWEHYAFPFEAFGTDAHDLTGLLFGAGGPESGGFTLYIDNVRLE
ncbi:MAG: CIA30 family protein [Candidatus Krumholzibacteriia bacterium]